VPFCANFAKPYIFVIFQSLRGASHLAWGVYIILNEYDNAKTMISIWYLNKLLEGKCRLNFAYTFLHLPM